MRIIYHLVPTDIWTASTSDSYTDPSLEREGFIHCSNADQVATIANLFYANQQALTVLHINADSLSSLVKDEAPHPPPTGEAIDPSSTFPHIYGPIPRGSILQAQPLQRNKEGQWTFVDA